MNMTGNKGIKVRLSKAMDDLKDENKKFARNVEVRRQLVKNGITWSEHREWSIILAAEQQSVVCATMLGIALLIHCSNTCLVLKLIVWPWLSLAGFWLHLPDIIIRMRSLFEVGRGSARLNDQ